MTSPQDEPKRARRGDPAPDQSHKVGHDQADLHTYDTERHLPASHNPLPAFNAVGQQGPTIDEDAYVAVQGSPEFIELRRKFRNFAFPLTAAFLLWYFAYVLLSIFARPFMSQDIGLGNLNLGHVLGLLQFATTFFITWLYLRHMRKNIDPLAADLRAKLEGKTKP